MNTEYEATFYNVDQDMMRKKLRQSGAKLFKDEFLQKRTVFSLPGGDNEFSWLRVCDEGDRITMSVKEVGPSGIRSQKELELVVSDYNTAVAMLE